MATWVGCIWKAPFTSVQVLQPLDATMLSTVPRAITADGSTIFGTARRGDGMWKAVKWNTTTLAVTTLADIQPGNNSTAVACSADGSIIIGGKPMTTPDTEYASDAEPLIRWTGGGTAGALLPDHTGAPNTDVAASWPYGPVMPTKVSDNGVEISAIDYAELPATGSKWTNGAYVTLQAAGSLPTDGGAANWGTNRSGSIHFGISGDAASLTDPGDACYWVGTTLRRLVHASTPTATNQVAFLSNADGSIIWGSVDIEGLCYWSNLTTLSGDGLRYGVIHILQHAGGNFQISYCAENSGALVAVGQNAFADDGFTQSYATKWNGTTAVKLGAVSGGNFSTAYSCSGDGSVVAGWSYDGAFVDWPVRWDASNTLHVLPTLADPADGFQGHAWGVSRDGSIIFGIMNVADVIPPPSSSLAMDNLLAYAAVKTSNLVFLKWSDDRAHSWSNPVSQPIGDRGEYLTSASWNRLGYARDRVFSIEWSVPVATALIGAYITVDASAKS